MQHQEDPQDDPRRRKQFLKQVLVESLRTHPPNQPPPSRFVKRIIGRPTRLVMVLGSLVTLLHHSIHALPPIPYLEMADLALVDLAVIWFLFHY